MKVLNSAFVGNSGTPRNGASRWRFGVFEVDQRAGELRRNGFKVKLQEQPFQILAALLERPGEVVSREDLRNRLWPSDIFVDFDRSLNAAIKRLRDALGDSAENPRFVETVARRGYRFLAPVQPASSNGNGANLAEAVVLEPVTPSAGRTRPWWILAGAGALLLILLGIKLGLSLARHHAAPQVRVTQLTANPADDRVRAAAISPDGKYLAFSDEAGFYLRQIDTGETHAVQLPEGLKPTHLSWFPDSVHMVAALASPDLRSSLWEISALGGNARKLSDDGRLPAVSPDGRTIAFITGKRMSEEIWMMSSDGSNRRSLLGGEGHFFGAVAWSRDGMRIAYTGAKFSYPFGVKGTIEFVDLRDMRVTSLLQVASMGWFASIDGPIAWAPDGRIIYSASEPPPRQRDSNLWSIQVDPQGKAVGSPERLTSEAGTVFGISASTSNRLAYLKGVPQPDVYVANVNSNNEISEPRRLTLDDRQDIPFDWTADGKSVVFISDRTGTFGLYRQDIDQAVPDLLAGGEYPLIGPRVSPDGTQLIYLQYPNWSKHPSSAALMRMPVGGGPPQQILEGKWISNEQCARAPATLCVYSLVSEGLVAFYSFDLLQGSGERIYEIKDDLPQAYNWSLSPDGTMLAISKGKEGGDEPRIRLVLLKTGAERVIEVRGWPGVASLDWAADGRSLWAVTVGGEGNALLNIDLRGNARAVWRPKKLTAGWAIPSRDGRHLALHVGSTSANVWMLENF